MPETKALAADYTGFRELPEDTLEAVEEKARRYQGFRGGRRFLQDEMACDLYIAAFLLPKTGGPPSSRGARTVPTSEDVWRARRDGQVWGPLIQQSMMAKEARAFHWPLEFPNAMARGGFDVVLGNPPWEVMQLSEQEYFAARHPEIAGLAGAARKRAIADLAHTDPKMFTGYEAEKRRAEAATEFARESGRFGLTARGKVNTYALFAELFARLAGIKGRAGVIVPTGIATDATTAPFFADLVAKRRLHSIVAFSEIRALFPATDDRNSFCLLTLGRDERLARFVFSLWEASERLNPDRSFTLTPEQIACVNPNTLTAPMFRSRADAGLAARIYDRVPVLIDERRGPAGNPWGVEFRQGLFNMTTDSHLFRTAVQLRAEGWVRQGSDWITSEVAQPRQAELAVVGAETGLLPLEGGGPREARRYVPLYEAKMIHQFDHRWAGYDVAGTEASDATLDQKLNLSWEPSPRFWAPTHDPREGSGVESRLRAKGWTRNWLMGWRGVTRSTDQRTAIFSLAPRTAIGDPMQVYFSDQGPEALAGLLGCFNSLVLDYVTRLKVVGTHLSFNYLRQLPILPPTFYTEPCLAFVVPRVLELTYTSHALAPFARDLGHAGPPFPWDESRRARLRAELDAFYARAYGLSRDDLRYVLDPADAMGPNYPSETFRVLKEKEIRLHGEYRTARLVLAAWDRLEAECAFRPMGL